MQLSLKGRWWVSFFFVFFPRRRRHTRFDCDWSSDVCSSDLGATLLGSPERTRFVRWKTPPRIRFLVLAAGEGREGGVFCHKGATLLGSPKRTKFGGGKNPPKNLFFVSGGGGGGGGGGVLSQGSHTFGQPKKD